jgi:hypothetical protein
MKGNKTMAEDTQVIPDVPCDAMSIPLSSMLSLATEYWRLCGALRAVGVSAPGRHALRKMEDFLRECELEIQTLDGRPYDPGLAVRVIDAVEDSGMAGGQAVIEETLSPMILWRGRVVRQADVVVRQGKM